MLTQDISDTNRLMNSASLWFRRRSPVAPNLDRGRLLRRNLLIALRPVLSKLAKLTMGDLVDIDVRPNVQY